MSDIYATPESDLAYHGPFERGGGNIEDAIAGNIEVRMLETLGEAWRGLKGFKLKCHIATVIWLIVYLIAAMISVPVVIGLVAVVTIGWELLEFLLDTYVGTEWQGSIADTIKDQLLGVLGATVAVLWLKP